MNADGRDDETGRWRHGGPTTELQSATEELRRRLAGLRPDTRLPPGRTLARELGFSRATVGSALRVLEREGVVVSGGAGRGAGFWTPGGPPHMTGPEHASDLIASRLERAGPGERIGTTEDLAHEIPGMAVETMRIALTTFAEDGLLVPHWGGTGGWFTPTEPAGVTVAQAFTDRLREDIRVLPRGHEVDPPTPIARRYTVTLATAARAMERLEREGLVVRNGQGRNARRWRAGPPPRGSDTAGSGGAPGADRVP